jgi:GNAT superfamily N-acetyltransferase
VNARIALAEDRESIARCFPVMRELRTHLRDESEFIERVLRQREQGYRLAFLETAGEVRAAAGYRLSENLAWGRFLYVDDLVTRADERSAGHGRALFDWLVAEARREGCAQFHLDSGVQRFAAHRFYLARRMDITSHHFGLALD